MDREVCPDHGVAKFTNRFEHTFFGATFAGFLERRKSISRQIPGINKARSESFFFRLLLVTSLLLNSSFYAGKLMSAGPAPLFSTSMCFK